MTAAKGIFAPPSYIAFTGGSTELLTTPTMKHTIIIALLLVLAAPVWSQPEITSMDIDERDNTLTLKGVFGETPGSVMVDNETLEIISWSDSLISSKIGESGKGSAGPVRVASDLGTSKASTISLWSLDVDGRSWHYYSCGMVDETDVKWTLSFRAALESVIFNGTKKILSLRNRDGRMTAKHVHIAPIYDDCNPGDRDYTKFDTAWINTSMEMNTDGRWATLYLPDPAVMLPFSFTEPKLTFDSEFVVLDGQNSTDGSSQGGGATLHWKARTEFPVRHVIIKARYPLPVVSPMDSSTLSGAPVYFAWESAEWADHYDLELARDDHFTVDKWRIQLVEPVAEVNLSKSSGRYFWRVRASTDSVDGRWSETRSFTIGSSTVGQHISTRLTSSLVQVYDVLGRLVLQYQGVEEDLRTKHLPSGNYLITSAEHKAQLRFIP